MKRVLLSVLSLLLSVVSLSLAPPSANAQPIDFCRLEAPSNVGVTLGFPRLPERLVSLKSPKILVIPFRLKGEPEFELSPIDKKVFLQSAEDIKKLSRGKSEITFIYNPTVDVDITALELDIKGDDSKAANNKPREFNDSTAGFVTQVIQNNDSEINYSGIDAVILVGNSQKINLSLQQAFPRALNNPDVTKTGTGPFKTEEKDIFNVALLYNHLEHTILTHELGHLYGLPDIYGSPASIPFSLMDAQSIDLFAYEQWMLGWLPDSSVTCINESNELSQNPEVNKFLIDYTNGDKLIIIPTSNTTAIIIDVIHYTDSILDQKILFFYTLNTTIFPAIQAFDSTSKLSAVTVLNNFGGVGKVTTSPSYNLLISDNDGNNVQIHLIPKNEINSEASIQIVKRAESKRLEIETKIKSNQEAKVVADLKAKQDLESRATADLKAKQEAEAKAAALKKTTINCVKGKTIKKVTAIKPKCPAGFKTK